MSLYVYVCVSVCLFVCSFAQEEFSSFISSDGKARLLLSLCLEPYEAPVQAMFSQGGLDSLVVDVVVVVVVDAVDCCCCCCC